VSKVSKAPSDTPGVKSVTRRGDTHYDTPQGAGKVSASFDTLGRLVVHRQPDFALLLRPLLTGWRIPVTMRLRGALKLLLRGFGFRAIECKPVERTQEGSR